MKNADECGLLIVDIQGTLANLVANSEMTISNTVRLIKSCQALSIPVVVLEQNPKGLGPTTLEIERCLVDPVYFEKHTFNALDDEKIKRHIKSMNKKYWLVAGIEAHICVYQTVKGLIREGTQVELLSDCISSRLESNVTLAIQNLRHLGANITSMEMCIYEILQSCRNERFKAVLNIVK